MQNPNPIPYHCEGMYRTRKIMYVQARSWPTLSATQNAVRLLYWLTFSFKKKLACLVTTHQFVGKTLIFGMQIHQSSCQRHISCAHEFEKWFHSSFLPPYVLHASKTALSSELVGASHVNNTLIYLNGSGRYRKFVKKQQSKTGCAELSSLLLKVR